MGSIDMLFVSHCSITRADNYNIKHKTDELLNMDGNSALAKSHKLLVAANIGILCIIIISAE